MKMTVLYHSPTGTTKQMAEVITQGMMSVAGVEAKAFSIKEIDEAWAKESKCFFRNAYIHGKRNGSR